VLRDACTSVLIYNGPGEGLVGVGEPLVGVEAGLLQAVQEAGGGGDDLAVSG